MVAEVGAGARGDDEDQEDTDGNSGSQGHVKVGPPQIEALRTDEVRRTSIARWSNDGNEQQEECNTG